jgi:hypothetical protein
VKQAMMLESDRASVLREMIYVCRPAGILSIPGVYGGLVDKNLDAVVLLVPERPVQLGALLQPGPVGDDEGRIDLTLKVVLRP